jgi:hypothetical protein
VGKTYEVNINADPEHFLDWDKPLSEQSPHVKNVLQAGKWAGPKAEGTGGEFMRDLSPEDHSQLGKEGIPGIKYLDQGSRYSDETSKLIQGAGSREAALVTAQKRLDAANNTFGGKSDRQYWQKAVDELQKPETKNYVVFNDKIINIVKKYGLAGLVAGGAAHFSTTPVEHDPFSGQQ